MNPCEDMTAALRATHLDIFVRQLLKLSERASERVKIAQLSFNAAL